MSLTRDDFETETCRGCGRDNYRHHEPCYYSEHNKPYQVRATKWIVDTFGQESVDDIKERNDRFAEETAELLQACGYTESELHQMIAYVFSKEKGDVRQEIGGVIHTLSGLCSGRNIDMMQCAENELKRVEPLKEKIATKGRKKPRFLPVPISLITKSLRKFQRSNYRF